MGLISLKMRSLRGNLIAAYTYLMGRGKEDRDRMSSEANRKMVRKNRQNLQYGKLLLDIRKDGFTVRIVNNWNRCLKRF